MKYSTLFCLGLWLFWTAGCEKELKEHPISPELKLKLEKQNDPALAAKRISGKITLEDAETQPIPPNAVLFVFVRSADGRKGPPLAAKRYAAFSFPMEYAIGPEDAMMEGVQFGDEVRIIARIDADGVAGAGAGDIEGELTVKPGEKNVDIVLKASQAPGQKGELVTGTITVAEELQDKLPANAVLFIIARVEGERGKPPLAVQRFESFEFPYQYSIGQADVMMPGAVFQGAMVITVRLDSDGNAAASKGDVEGTKAAKPGDENTDILMDRLVGG